MGAFHKWMRATLWACVGMTLVEVPLFATHHLMIGALVGGAVAGTLSFWLDER